MIVPGGQPELCDLCAAVIYDGSEQYATVRDSSAVEPHSSTPDGERQLVACGREHLDELVGIYENRPYDEDELYAYVLLRAARLSPDHHDVEDLAFMTGLGVVEVMRAQRWLSVWSRWLPADRCSE